MTSFIDIVRGSIDATMNSLRPLLGGQPGAPPARAKSLTELRAALAAERKLQQGRVSALAQCLDCVDPPPSVEDIQKGIDAAKARFEQLQQELKDEAAKQLAAIDQFNSDYDKYWTEAIKATERYMRRYPELLPDLKEMWEALGDREFALQIADALDTGIQVGLAFVDGAGIVTAGMEEAAPVAAGALAREGEAAAAQAAGTLERGAADAAAQTAERGAAELTAGERAAQEAAERNAAELTAEPAPELAEPPPDPAAAEAERTVDFGPYDEDPLIDPRTGEKMPEPPPEIEDPLNRPIPPIFRDRPRLPNQIDYGFNELDQAYTRVRGAEREASSIGAAEEKVAGGRDAAIADAHRRYEEGLDIARKHLADPQLRDRLNPNALRELEDAVKPENARSLEDFRRAAGMDPAPPGTPPAAGTEAPWSETDTNVPRRARDPLEETFREPRAGSNPKPPSNPPEAGAETNPPSPGRDPLLETAIQPHVPAPLAEPAAGPHGTQMLRPEDGVGGIKPPPEPLPRGPYGEHMGPGHTQEMDRVELPMDGKPPQGMNRQALRDVPKSSTPKEGHQSPFEHPSYAEDPPIHPATGENLPDGPEDVVVPLKPQPIPQAFRGKLLDPNKLNFEFNQLDQAYTRLKGAEQEVSWIGTAEEKVAGGRDIAIAQAHQRYEEGLALARKHLADSELSGRMNPDVLQELKDAVKPENARSLEDFRRAAGMNPTPPATAPMAGAEAPWSGTETNAPSRFRDPLEDTVIEPPPKPKELE